VAVGGNHTMVGVGVSVGGGGVSVGRDEGVNIGEQPASPPRQSRHARTRKSNFISLVYYKCCKIRPQGSVDVFKVFAAERSGSWRGDS
jgi:hypothetical protein